MRDAFRQCFNRCFKRCLCFKKQNKVGAFGEFDLESYRRAFDKDCIPDSLERVINQHIRIQLTGAETLYRLLLVHGVRNVFGYSGGAVLPLIDAFHSSYTNQHRKQLKFFDTVNEHGAAHAAQAYGRLTGKPGIAIVTSGPGLTNCITALQDSFMDGDPLILLSGQVPTHAMGTDAFQECPATALTKACTKWNYLAMDVPSLPWAIETAFRIAMTGRKGPVHIDLPKNVLAGEGLIPQASTSEWKTHYPGKREISKFNEDNLHEILSRLSRCERPIIIAGHGAVDCVDEIQELAMKGEIPVASTLLGLGIFDENQRLSLCMLGMHGSVYANYAIQNADLIMCIGSRFGILSAYAPAAYKAAKDKKGGIIQLEIENRQIGKTVKPHLYLNADCKESLKRILSLLPAMTHTRWLQQEWKTRYPFGWVNDHEFGTIKTQQAIAMLYHVTKRNKKFRVTTGVGNHQMMTAQQFRWSKPNQMITSGGLGTMGTGLPFAIGIQIAYPEELVLLIDGDGSFNMSATELGTVAKFNLPIKIAIMNDGVQQMVRAWQQLFFGGRYMITKNQNPNYVQLAEAYGIPALLCDNIENLESTCLKLIETNGPFLVEFRVVPDLCLPMVQPGKALDDLLLNKSQLNNKEFSPALAPS